MEFFNTTREIMGCMGPYILCQRRDIWEVEPKAASWMIEKSDLPKVNWRKMVCNNMGCLKWKFILWLALKGDYRLRISLGNG
ncbi:hypothetical protein H5410_002589 [Solanum commersonii]|uniref:Uncharacterized protein n=1 Tax=Solanum commersonii TaxID=4109 RepID=A0A9J6B2J1_SOLCO|nr:hypothetical protein H5410_002589 [Solanum commersonii]